MSLLLPTQRTFNPSQFVGLSGSPLARGLVYASGADFRFNQANTGNGARVGGAVVTTPRGPALKLNGTSEYVKLGTAIGGVDLFADSTRTWSVVALVKQAAANSNGAIVAKTSQSPTLRAFHLYFETGVILCHTRGYQTNLGGSASNTDFQLITQTWDGAVSTAYRDAAAPVSVGVGTAANEPSEPILFGARYSGTSLLLAGEIAFVLIYNRAISQAEHLAILKTPGIVFAPQPRRMWVPSAGGSVHTADYSDSAAPTDSAAAVFVATATFAETLGASDTIAATLDAVAAYAETAATADAYTATLVVAGQSEYSDTATPLDAISAALVTSTAWVDAAVPVDSIAAALVAQSAYADSAAPADSYDATLVSGGTSSYADQATPVDAYTAVFIARADYADACTAQDLYAGVLAGEADPALRQSIYLRLADQAPFVRLSDQSPIAKL